MLSISHGLTRLLHAGLADPVYAEAYVTVHQYDIVLDVTVINRTSDTLQARGLPTVFRVRV